MWCLLIKEKIKNALLLSESGLYIKFAYKSGGENISESTLHGDNWNTIKGECKIRINSNVYTYFYIVELQVCHRAL